MNCFVPIKIDTVNNRELCVKVSIECFTPDMIKVKAVNILSFEYSVFPNAFEFVTSENDNNVGIKNKTDVSTVLLNNIELDEQTLLSSTLSHDIVTLKESKSKNNILLKNKCLADIIGFDSSQSSENLLLKNVLYATNIITNRQERKEHIDITQPSPNGAEIILNPNKTGEKFDLFQSVPTGHGVMINPILFEEGLDLSLPVPTGHGVVLNPILFTEDFDLSLPVPPGTAATVNKITGSQSVKLAQPIPTGDDVLFVNGTSANSASVKNSGKASIGDCVGGESGGVVSAKNSAIPEIISSVPASQMSELKAVSDTQPQQIGLVNMLSILGMKMLWKAEAAAVIPWEYPAQNGDVLSVTQVYSATQNDAVLEVT